MEQDAGTDLSAALLYVPLLMLLISLMANEYMLRLGSAYLRCGERDFDRPGTREV